MLGEAVNQFPDKTKISDISGAIQNTGIFPWHRKRQASLRRDALSEEDKGKNEKEIT